jgi:hypothetical protein
MNGDGNYDDDSDLTELTDSGEEQEQEQIQEKPISPIPSRGSTRPATQASSVRTQNAGKIIPRLRPHRATLYSTASVHRVVLSFFVSLLPSHPFHRHDST